MKKLLYLLLFIPVAIHLYLLINSEFTAWPEMLAYPYLRNQGFLLYGDMIHPYPPLLTMFLSVVYKYFGYQLTILKIFTWLMVGINDLLIAFLVNKLTKSFKYALLALFLYLFVQPLLDGNMLWFDPATITPLLFSLVFIFRFGAKEGNRKYNIFLAGIFLALATLIKQTSAIFFIASVFYLFFTKNKIKDLLLIFLGPLVMGTLLLIRLVQEKSLVDFINWTLIYPSKYWTSFSGYVKLDIPRADLITILLLTLPVFILLATKIKFLLKGKDFYLLLIYFLVSGLCVYPRFSFFHLQPAIAFLVILWVWLLKNTERKVFPVTITIVFIGIFIIRTFVPNLKQKWQKETRFYSVGDVQKAEIIAKLVSSDEKVFLLGLNSSLYPMSGKIPPKRWFDNFGWYLEIPGVQDEILGRWDTDSPQYIVWQKPITGPWYELGVYQPQLIASWIRDNYNEREEVFKEVWLWEKKTD